MLLNRMIARNVLTFVRHFPRFLAPVVPIRKCTLSCAPFVQTASYNSPLMLWVIRAERPAGEVSEACGSVGANESSPEPWALAHGLVLLTQPLVSTAKGRLVALFLFIRFWNQGWCLCRPALLIQRNIGHKSGAGFQTLTADRIF